MIYLPMLFFGIAAIGGITLVTMKYRGKGLSMPLAIVHGIFAATGLVFLIINVALGYGNTLMNFSLVLFIITALGGFTVFSFHVRKKKMSNNLIILHASGAILSFLILIIAVIK